MKLPEPSKALFKGVKIKTKYVESRTKGTMILRYSGRFYKIIKVRSRGDNNYTFECKDIDTKQSKTLKFSLSGFLEAVDKALPALKSPKDIFFLDLDNEGKWKVVNEDQIRRL
ncbi:hypothetical protein MUP77_18140 [Candidatus Bathyarchaeota archaeon]|nr:hypothetical protein [Candidatus Bathyarchaeota archaeon]